MPDFEEGTPDDPHARLKGEILGALSDWSASHDLVRLELPWTVAQMLLRHTSRSQPLEVYVEFLERLADIAGEQARDLKKAMDEDVRRHAH
ncbi:hypothetical protein [Shinella sp.]|uniref:hypothetical protein n=1 Tax=Shinella sp. TaxID=1870904 RepID=UPI003F71E672